MRFRVLGPITVEGDDGGARPLPPSARAVLAMLLIARRPVPPDRLADWLWASEPPPGWSNALQAHVKTLRRTLEPDARRASRGWSRIVLDGDGYCLRSTAGEIDADELERLLQVGRAAAARADARRAADAYRAALQLWRGPAFAEFADRPWATSEALRLDAVHAQLRSDWFGVELDLGHHEAIIGELERAVIEDPLREPLTAQLMLARYRSGRQSDALAAYRALAVRLDEELGIEPSTQLRRLETAIVRQEPDLDVPAPQPASLATLPRAAEAQLGRPFVGRARELSKLDGVLDRVERGDSAVVLVAGEPGIGKTRLTAEFARSAHGRGARVLWGRGIAFGGSPFEPFIEALSAFVGDAAADVSHDTARAAADDALHSLDPERANDARGRVADDSRRTQFDAVADALGAIAEASPLVLVLDDLHWADEPSLMLLQHLSRHAPLARTLIVAVFRDTHVVPPHLLAVPGVTARAGGELMLLDGLSADEVDTWLGRRVDASWLVEWTSGNPFFIEQALHDLPERGTRRILPNAVRDVIVDRVDQLSSDARRVLEAAAVLGTPFALEVLVRCTELRDAAVVSVLAEAERARLVQPSGNGGSFAFVHALAEDAIRDQIPAAARAVLHHRAAVALEALGADAATSAELAFHYARSGDPRGWHAAIEHYDIAARRARSMLAPEEAMRHYEAALDLVNRLPTFDEARRCDLVLGLGEARFRAGRRVEAKEAFAAAAEVAPRLDPVRHARVALATTGWGMQDVWTAFGTVNPAVVATLEDALARLGTDAPALRSRLLARLAECLYFSDDRRLVRRSADDALALAEATAESDALMYALQAALRTSWTPHNLDERVGLARRLVDAAYLGSDLEDRAAALVLLVTNLFEAGEFAEADRLIERHAALAAQLEYPLPRLGACALRGARALMRGELATCEQLAEAAAAAAPDYFALESTYAGVYCILRVEQGRSREMIDAALAFVDRMPMIPAWRAGLSVLLAHAGEIDDARKQAHAVLDSGALERPDAHFLFLAGALAETVSITEDRDVARELRRALAGLEDHWVVLGEGFAVWTHASRCLGVAARTLGDLEESERLLRRSADEHARAGADALLARSKLELARTLVRLGRDAEAATHAARARAIAATHGQRGIVDQLTVL